MLQLRAYPHLILVASLAAMLGVIALAGQPATYLWSGAAALAAALGLLIHRLKPTLPGSDPLAGLNLMESASAGLALLDADGRVRWANHSVLELFGTTADELSGRTLAELLPGDQWAALTRPAAKTRRTLKAQGSLEHAGGQRLVEAELKPLDTEQDPEHGAILQLVDVSAARRAEKRVQLAEARLTGTLDLATDLILKADATGRVRYANAAANAVLSDGSETLLGRNMIDFVSHDDRAGFVRAFRECQSGSGEPVAFSRLRLLSATEDGTPDLHVVSARLVPVVDDQPTLMLVCQDIHEQLASLEALRNSETRFSRIFHASPDAILIARQTDSLILDFNSGFTRMLGYQREEAIGQLESDLPLFVDAEERAAIAERLAQTSEVTGFEATLRARSGDVVTVEVALRYIEIDGEVCVLCIGRDISKRVAAETALRVSEEKFEQVFRRSPDGIAILRRSDLVICDLNESFIAASEYSRDELIGRSLSDLDVFEHQSALGEAAEILTAQGHISNLEIAMLTKSGARVQTLISATLVDIDGEPCILCIAKNVNELREAERRLRESEQRFRGAFENSPVGIVLINLDGRIFQANNFAVELLDYDEGALEGTHISRLIPAGDRQQFKEMMDRLLGGKETAIRSEQRMMRQDGFELWTNFHIVMQHDGRGEPQYLIAQVADISEMKSSQSRMERMAFYDTLTNLANRRLFYDRLGQAIGHAQRSSSLSALLYLDLDQFKRVNDTLGHEIGDQLLQEVSTRLTGSVRKEDTVARLGGDEFTVLLFNITSPTDASIVAEKILQNLRRPLNISGHQLVITTSIGITIVPQDGTDPNSLMKNADLAMYRAKEHGRNIFQFYSEEMNTNAITRLRTEYELRRALEREEFVLHYQPKVCLQSRQVVGVECLIRWDHPERGLLSPFEFIEVAEETGAIVDIGSWIIRDACRTGKQLHETAGRDMQIAVNISPRQFKDPTLVSTIRRSLRETGLDPGSLEVEITETMLMSDVDAANQTVEKLHELGVRLAIDDFGTGYSSLNYLKKFPINTVKVDRSFIIDIPQSADDKAITSAVIAMAHRLNMEVVAEGVETREQLDFLVEHGCEYAQGYLFSKPLRLDNIRHMVQPNVRIMRNR